MSKSKFKVGQSVIRKAVPGCGQIEGIIRFIHPYEDTFIIQLTDGNYGGEDLFIAEPLNNHASPSQGRGEDSGKKGQARADDIGDELPES